MSNALSRILAAIIKARASTKEIDERLSERLVALKNPTPDTLNKLFYVSIETIKKCQAIKTEFNLILVDLKDDPFLTEELQKEIESTIEAQNRNMGKATEVLKALVALHITF